MAHQSSKTEQSTSKENYGKRKTQIKKQDLYMLTALWMEQSPWAMNHDATDKEKEKSKERVVGMNHDATDKEKEKSKERVVGAVFVRPNDRVLSVDCSRRNEGGIVHGAIRALIQYPDQVEGCYVYLSRQPCAHCVKMLVQAAVKKVFYLPLKPEKDEREESKSIDALFKVSPVSREVYVPNITQADLEEVKSANEKNLYGTRNLETDESITSKVGWDEWKKDIVHKIGWDEYSDKKIEEQVDEDMKMFFQWFDLGILETGEKEMMEFQERKSDTTQPGPSKAKNQRLEQSPVTREVANHLSRLAQMLSNRTDDPNRGVGCVIALEKEIVATGWNGFPAKALYGNHPRAGKKAESEDARPDKYPHVIHAEQNALMGRKRRNLDGATAFVNKIPCNECLPMLCEAGVDALYLSKKAFDDKDKKRKSEKNFYELLDKPEKKLTVYEQAV